MISPNKCFVKFLEIRKFEGLRNNAVSCRPKVFKGAANQVRNGLPLFNKLKTPIDMIDSRYGFFLFQNASGLFIVRNGSGTRDIYICHFCNAHVVKSGTFLKESCKRNIRIRQPKYFLS